MPPGRPRKIKPTKSETFHQELRKSVTGRDRKQALDDFVGAVNDLTRAFGKTAAMTLFVKCGMLITLAKDEEK